MASTEERRVECPLCYGSGLLKLPHLLVACPDCGGHGTVADNHITLRMRSRRENGGKREEQRTG